MSASKPLLLSSSSSTASLAGSSTSSHKRETVISRLFHQRPSRSGMTVMNATTTTTSNSNNNTNMFSSMNYHRQIMMQKARRQVKKRRVISLCGLVFVLALWSLFLRSQDLEESFSLHHAGPLIPTGSKAKNGNYDICFLKSVFGNVVVNDNDNDNNNNNANSPIDRPNNVTKLAMENPNWKFYYFTNLEPLETPGWTKILETTLPYKRPITMSRYPKFLGWKYPQISKNCELVIYLDGHFRPRAKKSLVYNQLAWKTLQNKYGLLQTLHPKGGPLSVEMDRIVSGSKDTRPHVDAALTWMQSQPDWNDNATLYWNAVFGYDPKSVWFQNASLFFWDRYSQELDSWRDQPLWAYTLHHVGIHPLEMTRDTLLRSYIIEDYNLKGDHHYYGDNNNNNEKATK